MLVNVMGVLHSTIRCLELLAFARTCGIAADLVSRCALVYTSRCSFFCFDSLPRIRDVSIGKIVSVGGLLRHAHRGSAWSG